MIMMMPRFYEQFSAEQEEHQDVKIITSIQGGSVTVVNNDDQITLCQRDYAEETWLI